MHMVDSKEIMMIILTYVHLHFHNDQMNNESYLNCNIYEILKDLKSYII